MKKLAATVKTKQQSASEQWRPLQSNLSTVKPPGPWAWTSLREGAGCIRASHPSYDSSCGSVMCFLAWGWTGWTAGTSRTSPWVLSCLSGASRITKLKPFPLMFVQGRSCCSALGLLFVITVVWMTFLNSIKVFLCIYDIMCFIFIMRFGSSPNKALFDRHHDLVCLFSSEATGAAGLEPGNILITTIQSQHCVLRSKRWIAVRDLGRSLCPQKHDMIIWVSVIPHTPDVRLG